MIHPWCESGGSLGRLAAGWFPKGEEGAIKTRLLGLRLGSHEYTALVGSNQRREANSGMAWCCRLTPCFYAGEQAGSEHSGHIALACGLGQTPVTAFLSLLQAPFQHSGQGSLSTGSRGEASSLLILESAQTLPGAGITSSSCHIYFIVRVLFGADALHQLESSTGAVSLSNVQQESLVKSNHSACLARALFKQGSIVRPNCSLHLMENEGEHQAVRMCQDSIRRGASPTGSTVTCPAGLFQGGTLFFTVLSQRHGLAYTGIHTWALLHVYKHTHTHTCLFFHHNNLPFQLQWKVQAMLWVLISLCRNPTSAHE